MVNQRPVRAVVSDVYSIQARARGISKYILPHTPRPSSSPWKNVKYVAVKFLAFQFRCRRSAFGGSMPSYVG
jgi:hypothetical protein